MAVLSRGNLFDPVIVNDLITKVKGHSSLAVLSAKEPLSFNGNKEFIFTMDSDIDIVAENGKKTPGGLKIEPRIVTPIKIEYGARVSDEFMIASEEEQINILKAFNDGFAKKMARGLDLMAMHGVNPRTKKPSEVIGNNHFDAAVTQTVNYTDADPESNVEAAVGMIHGAEGDVTGMAMAPSFATALSKMAVNGVRLFPELAWGANPGAIRGLKVDVNTTVSDVESKDRAIIGDFQTMFSWGYAKQIPLEIIRYGDPDNTGNDLRGYNQVYLRAEAFLGWGILDASAFVRIVQAG